MKKLAVVLGIVLCVGIACSDDDPMGPSGTIGVVSFVGPLTDAETGAVVSIRLRIEYDALVFSAVNAGRHAIRTGPVGVALSWGNEHMEAAAAAMDSSTMYLLYVSGPATEHRVQGSIHGLHDDSSFTLSWLAEYQGRLGGDDIVSIDDIFAAPGRAVVSGVEGDERWQLRGDEMLISVRGTKKLVDMFDGESP
jgi:hypothetical protein